MSCTSFPPASCGRGKICVIGNGVVVDPVSLVAEIDELKRLGVRVKNLCVSESAHLVLPYHRELDAQREIAQGQKQNRHHQTRHRPGLRRQGGADGLADD